MHRRVVFWWYSQLDLNCSTACSWVIASSARSISRRLLIEAPHALLRDSTPRSKKGAYTAAWSKLEHVEDVERVIGIVHSIYPAEARLSGECANAFLAHAGPGAHAAGRERLGHAVIDAGGIAECAKPERVLDVAGEIAEQVCGLLLNVPRERVLVGRTIEIYRWLDLPHWERAAGRLEALGREGAVQLRRAFRDGGRYNAAIVLYGQLHSMCERLMSETRSAGIAPVGLDRRQAIAESFSQLGAVLSQCIPRRTQIIPATAPSGTR